MILLVTGGCADGADLTGDSDSGEKTGPGGTTEPTGELPTGLICPNPNEFIDAIDQDGAALLAALAGITGAGPSSPYVLEVEPGIYWLAEQQLTMKEQVDIEGSGELTTKIWVSGTADTASGTVVAADNTDRSILMGSVLHSRACRAGACP